MLVSLMNYAATMYLKALRCQAKYDVQVFRVAQPAGALEPGCEEMERERGNEEEMERE